MQTERDGISGFAQPEPTFILTQNQLSQIVQEALSRSQGSMIGKVDDRYILREEFDALKDRMANQSARIVALEMDLDKLQAKEPGKTEIARVQRLIKYMVARADHKATFETLRGVLQVTPIQLRAVIKSANDLDPGRFEVRDDEHDKRKSWLFAKR